MQEVHSVFLSELAHVCTNNTGGAKTNLKFHSSSLSSWQVELLCCCILLCVGCMAGVRMMLQEPTVSVCQPRVVQPMCILYLDHPPQLSLCNAVWWKGLCVCVCLHCHCVTAEALLWHSCFRMVGPQEEVSHPTSATECMLVNGVSTRG